VPKPEAKPQPEPPKPIAKPEPPKQPDKKQKQDQDFDQLLKNLAKQAPALEKSDQPAKPQKQVASAQPASAQPNAPLGSQLTTSELDVLRQQIEDCWNLPAGAKDAKDLKVEVHIDVAADGSITSAEIVDDGRYDSDPFYRAAADSARRAALNPRCSKLHVPPEKYEQWKSINLFFDPKDQLS
jgi:outer membrane biosynthesis protein TonB